MSDENPEAAYWNEAGGNRWVANIDRLEAMLSGLSEQLLARAAPGAGERVLDIGCGGGITSAALADAVGESGRVVGADISAVILEVARKRYTDRGNLEFITADAGVHPFDAQQYDLLTSRFGVMFFPDPVKAFTNLHRAGKPGGRFVFMCWRPLDENPWMGTPVAAAFSVLTPPGKPDPDAPGPFSLADPTKIERILRAAGFDRIKATGVDARVNLGAADAAIEFMTKMGPAAEAFKEAEPAQQEAATAAMRDAMQPHVTDSGVVMDAATWLVEASID